jgi:FixJ family two-component response regulator
MNFEPAVPEPRISVAIVDDEHTVRVSLRRLCEALGLDATVYASGRDFINALDSGITRADCLLLDAHMPQMTGLDLQRHLVDSGQRLPTVVYTADDAPEAQARYTAAGVEEYLRKPIGGEELLAAISRAMAQRAD